MKKVYKIINCSTTVNEDSYENGEGKYVNCWSLSENFDSRILLKDYDSIEEILKTLNEKYLYHSGNDVKNWYIFEDPDLKTEIRFDTDQQVDEDNHEASEYKLELWKQDKMKLYAAHTVLYVKAIIYEEVNYDEMYKEAKNIGLGDI